MPRASGLPLAVAQSTSPQGDEQAFSDRFC